MFSDPPPQGDPTRGSSRIPAGGSNGGPPKWLDEVAEQLTTKFLEGLSKTLRENVVPELREALAQRVDPKDLVSGLGQELSKVVPGWSMDVGKTIGETVNPALTKALRDRFIPELNAAQKKLADNYKARRKRITGIPED